MNCTFVVIFDIIIHLFKLNHNNLILDMFHNISTIEFDIE